MFSAMEFLDNLILGYNTPKYADEAMFPSRTYKKPICNKKHCSTMCTTKLFAEFEFWAYVLSEKKLNRDDVRKNICTVRNDLRFSIWIKCSGCRDERVELQSISPSKTEDDAVEEKNREWIMGVEDGRMNDRALVTFILDACKGTDQNNQEMIFNISKNIDESFPGITRFKLLVMFVKHILELPYADPLLAYKLIYVLMKSYNFKDIFKDVAACPKDSLDEGHGLETNGDAVNAGKFWRYLIVDHQSTFDQMVDLLLCHENADVTSVPDFLRDQTQCNDVEKWIKFVSARSNIEMLCKTFAKKICKPVEARRGSEETYFDFLVVQNELIKAQENIRMELSEKIRELKDERNELCLQKDNLVNACNCLEAELKEFQEGYVSEVKQMLYDTKTQCERYEKENMELKSRLHGMGK